MKRAASGRPRPGGRGRPHTASHPARRLQGTHRAVPPRLLGHRTARRHGPPQPPSGAPVPAPARRARREARPGARARPPHDVCARPRTDGHARRARAPARRVPVLRPPPQASIPAASDPGAPSAALAAARSARRSPRGAGSASHSGCHDRSHPCRSVRAGMPASPGSKWLPRRATSWDSTVHGVTKWRVQERSGLRPAPDTPGGRGKAPAVSVAVRTAVLTATSPGLPRPGRAPRQPGSRDDRGESSRSRANRNAATTGTPG